MIPHTINIYSGGSYNEIHDCENVYLSCEKAEIRVDKKPTIRTDAPEGNSDEPADLPDVLRTPEAESLLAKLCNAGMLDKNWQSIGLSFAEKGTLIEYIAEKLNIRSKWKFFGALWQTDSETLRTSKARGLEQDKTWAFRSRLEAL